jgi:hypothetical protein
MLNLANCVNYPEEHILPNTELQEAVWFMETFFNMGICEKQKQFVEHTHSKKRYSINVPVEKYNDKEIVLKGQDLQMIYRDVLWKIVTDICPEYALNFGDVYVDAINTGQVVIGIDVLYGTKSEHKFSTTGRKKILPPGDYPPPYPYPNTAYAVLGDFHFYDKPDEDGWVVDYTKYHRDACPSAYCRDEFMETRLNLKPCFTATNIV